MDTESRLEIQIQENEALRQDFHILQLENKRLRSRLAWVKKRLEITTRFDYITQGEMLSDVALVRAVLSDPLDT